MASFIDPKCGLPLYLLDNEKIAENCGRINGYVVAGILTIIIVGISIALFIKYNNKTSTEIVLYLMALLFILLIIWWGVPKFSGWMNKNNFRVYQAQNDSFITKGFSKEQAIDKIQDLYKTNVQSNAILDGSLIIANGFRFANWNK